MATYQDTQTAQSYLEFLNSPNGQIQQEVLFKAIRSRLPGPGGIAILDAGCGPGWLTNKLKLEYDKVEGCDNSDYFIDFAKIRYPNIDFKLAEMDQVLPYQKHSFDFVILNMVGPDLNHLTHTFMNLSNLLKPKGKLIMTIPNPGLTYPAAVWKKSWWDGLLGRKPKLKIQSPPTPGIEIEREFGDTKIKSHYYVLADYATKASKADLMLKATVEIKSPTDSPEFDLNYQLYRYPLLLLLEFEKK